MKHSFKMTRTLFLLIATLATLSIAGCLVDDSDSPQLISRTTDTVRTLTSGDFFDYVVQGQITPTLGGTPQIFDGTLRIEYTLDNSFPNPFGTGGTIAPPNVFREVSTLTLGSGATPIVLTRYIQQDDLTGTIFVLAVEVGSILYRSGVQGGSLDATAIAINTSDVPLMGNDDFSLDYMSSCEGPALTCGGVVQTVIDPVTYQGNSDIATNEGRFQALRIDYSGSFTGGSAPTLFDLRGACDEDTASFFGSTYVFPEVGVVFIDTSCTSLSTGGGHRYTASLSNTNVPIP